MILEDSRRGCEDRNNLGLIPAVVNCVTSCLHYIIHLLGGLRSLPSVLFCFVRNSLPPYELVLFSKFVVRGRPFLCLDSTAVLFWFGARP